MAKKNLSIPATPKRLLRKIVARTSFPFLNSICLAATIYVVAGCASKPPYEEYTIARAAIQAAQDVDSARFAAGLWAKAEESYRSGEKSYREFEFGSARQYFKAATSYAERAEDATRMKKFETGDSFP